MSTQVTPFAWGEITISQVVTIDGIPHATKSAIGEWLEYADPRVGINGVLHSNPYIEEFSVDVKLTSTDGKNYDTKVYHPMGFLLIVMESGQPKAQSCKVAIAAFVWHFCGPKAISHAEEMKERQLKRQLMADMGKTKDALLIGELRREINVCNQRLGLPPLDLSLLGKNFDQLNLEGF